MGISRITNLITPAPSYELVDLATAKLQLNISDDSQDTFLTNAIENVSSAISRYCNRSAAAADEASFPIEAIVDTFFPDRDPYPYQTPGGVQPLQLSHWPIANLAHQKTAILSASGAVLLSLFSHAGISIAMPVGGAYNSLAGTPPSSGPQAISPGTTVRGLADATIGLSLPLAGDVPAGTALTIGGVPTTTTADTPSGSTLPVADVSGATAGAAVTSSNANIPAGATVASFTFALVTLSAPTINAIQPGTSIAFGMAVVQTDPPGSQTLLVEAVDFFVDGPRGHLLRLDGFTLYPTIWPAVRVDVTYSGGFASIPGDIEQAALGWLVQLYQSKDRDPTLRSQSQPGLGEQVFWIGTPSMPGGVPATIAGLLDRYRVPVTA